MIQETECFTLPNLTSNYATKPKIDTEYYLVQRLSQVRLETGM